MLFYNKKKKKNPALKIVLIIVGALAAVAAGYIVFEKFIKGKLCCCKKNAELDEACNCEEIPDEEEDVLVDEIDDALTEAEAAPADAE